MSLGPLYVFHVEVSVQVLCPFFNWVVCLPGVESCEFLIIFGDQILVQTIIGEYVFSYSWFSFHFNAVFLSHEEAFYYMMSHLFILYFVSLALGDIVVKILLCGMSEIFLPVFSSRSFMVSQPIFMHLLCLLCTLNLFFCMV